MKTEFTCVSVLGGWQTGLVVENSDKDLTFGPVFNKIQDLWKWQKSNLYSESVTY